MYLKKKGEVKMSKMKKIVMLVMIVLVSCLLISTTLEVKATSEDPIIDIGADGGLDITTGTENEQPEPNLNTENETTNEETQIIQPDTSTENSTDTLPKTGVTEDITLMFFIIVCAVSSIYAYKKIRDYKD